ncbi:DUF262 domain-containing protein [bacterium]|nr:DUF262 domain-containing protein [bacterium]
MAERDFDDEEYLEEEEYEPLNIPEEFRNIQARWERRTIRDIWSRILSGELVLEPEFQRHYVWDDIRASRFIESILLGMPVPPIFIAEEPDNRWVVVDGHQRLETIFRFLQPLLTKDKGDRDSFTKAVPPTKVEKSGARRFTALVLKNMEVLDELNRKKSTDIKPEVMRNFWDYLLSVVEIPKDVHPDLKYALFVRLNLGSMNLNAQEIRNCLYRGPYNDLIRDIGEDPKFLEAWGKKYPDKRMRDRERVLAFFAFAHGLDRYSTPRHRFLSKEMELNQSIPKEVVEEYRQEFWNSFEWCKRVFKENAFRFFEVGDEDDNPKGNWSRRRYDTIYELEMVGFYRYGDKLQEVLSGLRKAEQDDFLSGLRHKLVGVMCKPEFRETISAHTESLPNVRVRFGLWNEAMEEALNNPENVIAKARKVLELWRKSSACSLCPEPIVLFEDAELIEENGEHHLAHRCHRG